MLDALERFDPRDAVVHHTNGSVTRGEFRALVLRQARAFSNSGLRTGDRVMLVLPNSLDLLVATYACLAAGLVCVPVNTRAAILEITRMAGKCRPRMCLAGPAWRSKLAPALGCPVSAVASTEFSSGAAPDVAGPGWPDEHPALIYFTSGSTGEPKGVVYTHGTLRACSRMYRQAYGLTAADRSVLCHCMAHNFMFSQMTVPLLDAGGAVHIVDFGDLAQTAAAIENGATILMLIPWLAFDLAQFLASQGARPPALRLCLVGGDRVPQRLHSEIFNSMGIGLSQNIGLTETNTYAVDLAGSGRDKPGSIGLPLPGVRIDVRRSDGLLCDTGETGQIWVRSPACMRGYWEDEELTRATMSHGWVATGDLGHLDRDGVLWFDARHRHIIIRDGDNIYPGEVERAVALHPHIAQVTVFGVADGHRGERVVAAVTLRDNHELHPGRMRAFLSEHLPLNKQPTEWLQLADLPRNINAKIDLPALRQAHAANAMEAVAE